MSYTPNDPAFMRVVDTLIYGSWSDERVVFIDTENAIREVVYASEFSNGELQRIRKRLEDKKVLKGIVHVSATVLGSRSGAGPRYSSVEYLPGNGRYVRSHVVQAAHWVTQTDIIQAALDATDDIFNGEETPEEPDESQP